MWSKGHTPSIDDVQLADAVKNYNMMETGFQIDTTDLTKYEVELINLVKTKINEKNQKESMKLNQKAQGMM